MQIRDLRAAEALLTIYIYMPFQVCLGYSSKSYKKQNVFKPNLLYI